MKLKPLHDRLLVQRLDSLEQKTAGGLYIPDAAKEKPQVGQVLAVGTGRVTPEGTVIPLQVKAGDKVFFGKYSGTDLGTDAGENLLVIREDEILGILEN